LEKRFKLMAGEVAEQVADLEEHARQEPLPDGVAMVSCGLDRMSVRKVEPARPEQATTPVRRRPYVRTPPPPRTYHFRKAWVGTATVYDVNGKELHTWRYGEANEADPAAVARRVATDVARVLREHPAVAVHCIQDAAPELRALPEALKATFPSTLRARLVELVDFEHLMGYLDAVVEACEPAGDPRGLKAYFRKELLRDDRAIDRIWRMLRRKGAQLEGHDTPERKAVAAALSYIRHRRPKMRYASLHARNLPIGSGATEGTCWTMQRRVQRPGQSWGIRAGTTDQEDLPWQSPGLRGVLAVRGLVLSGRWPSAWQAYAAGRRKEVHALN
jgi:hypothetical protein